MNTEKNLFPSSLQAAYIYTGKMKRARTQAQRWTLMIYNVTLLERALTEFEHCPEFETYYKLRCSYAIMKAVREFKGQIMSPGQRINSSIVYFFI